VRHEQPPGGTSRPDILYENAELEFAFAVDISIASDKGLDESNPADPVFAFLRERAARHALPGGFDLRLQGELGSLHGKARMQLALPPSNWIDGAAGLLRAVRRSR